MLPEEVDVEISLVLFAYALAVESANKAMFTTVSWVEKLFDYQAGRKKVGYGSFSIEDMDRLLREETPQIGHWIDNSEMSVDATVRAIQARLPRLPNYPISTYPSTQHSRSNKKRNVIRKLCTGSSRITFLLWGLQ